MDSASKKKRGRRPKGEVRELKEEEETVTVTEAAHDVEIVIPILITDKDIDELENKSDEKDAQFYKTKYQEYKAKAMVWKRRYEEVRDKDINSHSEDPLSKIVELNYLKEHYERRDANNPALVCQWCCHSFTTPVCVVPDKIISGKFEVFGYMCSFNCALSYILDMRDERMFERISLLHHLYKKVTGENAMIKPAPKRETLKMFGGCLEINRFRNNFFVPKEEINYYVSNIAPLVPLVEIKYNEHYTNTEMLRRTKPRPNQYSLIEESAM